MTLSTLVCIIMQLNLINQPQAERIAEHIIHESRAHQLDPIVVLSVAYKESRLQHHATNHTSQDFGIMQLHCPWEDYAPWCNPRCVKSLKCNIAAGVSIISYRRDHCKEADHQHKSHWIRHYNWRNKRYDTEIFLIYRKIKELAYGCPQETNNKKESSQEKEKASVLEDKD